MPQKSVQKWDFELSSGIPSEEGGKFFPISACVGHIILLVVADFSRKHNTNGSRNSGIKKHNVISDQSQVRQLVKKHENRLIPKPPDTYFKRTRGKQQILH